ncbi:protease [Haliovirga abyssi]|uniref:Protease n=2 Tax=Haliovirga abyssi TaxID=2996794 RepID=A0AAU9DV80_9FUSO|nr:protease [Haliovirga abyssi]
MEIVAPAGSPSSLKAAIKAGADAVYLGIKGFGARRNAVNFGVDEIVEYIDYAHLRGVKIYLTLNSIMSDNEIESIYRNVKKLYLAGIDAIIVQDFGVFKFLKENFKNLNLHASTQMTITNNLEAKFLKENGFDRAVLARELSFEEIKKIQNSSKIDLEIFVSGALCISYSGKCYMSSFIGGRSGNRGMCAQPCRKLYNKDGEEKYFLSPKDQLLGKEEINLLKSINISSIKIEGRMKNEKYVYEIVKYYRKLVDESYSDDIGNKNILKIFNRGYSKGYFYGVDKENILNRENSADFGYEIGKIFENNRIEIKDKIKLGDGITFVDKDNKVIEGRYVNKIFLENNREVKEAEKTIIKLNKIPEGSKYIFKTYDKELDDNIEKDLKNITKRINIYAEIIIEKGKKLSLKFIYKNRGKEIKSEVLGEVITEKAKKSIDKKIILEKISELGETTFKINNSRIKYDGESFVSFKELKNLKRECAEKLEKNIIDFYKRKDDYEDIKKISEEDNLKNKSDKSEELVISATVFNENQENFLRKLGIEKIYKKGYSIINEDELTKINFEEKNKIEDEDDIKLSKNITQLVINKDKLTVDYSMNIFNSYALRFYENLGNIDTIFLSQEMSEKQIMNLKKGKNRLGIVVYGCPKVMEVRVPLFEEKVSELTNEFKDKYFVKINDLGHSELYLKKPLNLIRQIDDLESYGINEVRLDFTFEDEFEISRIIKNLKDRTGEYIPYNYEKGVF